jgi:putative membrane protein
MTVRTLIATTSLAVLFALPATAAPMMSGKQFVAKAGASDMWERKEAAIMTTSSNGDVSGFAKQMLVDHAKSTEMVKAAAAKDGLKPDAPMLSAKQKADFGALSASKGAARDSLYITQQKAAHADALALMKGYAATGRMKHLKATAGEIAPVVQGHIDMLGMITM